ncbi:MAG: bifunctional anthranilate synthase component II/anthranilate phosphoribosyltransferase [Acidobacteriota bacterium]
MILLIDNYDSFTFNIYQAIKKTGQEVAVKRNDAVDLAWIEKTVPSHIIISPGPGRPEKAGISVELVKRFAGKIPILGICLGHQAIGLAFGAKIVKAARLFHGKPSDIYHDGKGMFSRIKSPFSAVRYHSLLIDRTYLPEKLEISAWTEDNEIMGIRHKLYTVEGLQIHPESIGTEYGSELLMNFLSPEPAPSIIQSAIKKISASLDLSEDEAEKSMNEITSGSATAAQIASFLTSLAIKGESASEITGFVRIMRRKATPIKKKEGRILVDTCGTGGDRSGTFNISTCATFVIAGAGICVAKHGNRSITSRCGSADLMETLGINLASGPEIIEKALETTGIAFLFAPKLHLSMKHAVPVRVEMGIRTVFNMLGPLTNPAGADCQIIGVFDESIMEKIARTLISLSTARAMVVHGSDGLDEITLTGPTKIIEIKQGWMRHLIFNPQDYGFTCCRKEDLRGGDLKTNCEIVLSILGGEKGPRRDVVVLNAAAAIYIAGEAGTFKEAVSKAEASIDSGAALNKLEELIRITNQ